MDFAKQILQAHDWDLQAALETVTGGVGGSSAPEAGDVRAPLRTGYVDRLIDTSHEEEAMAAMAASQATEASRQELEDALRASEEEFLRQADIEEQAALAAAMEASQACQAHPSPPNSGFLKAAGPDRAVDNSGSHRRAAPSYPEPGLSRSVASNSRSPGAVPELNPRPPNGLPASRPAPSLESRYTPVTAAAFASSKHSNLQPQADGILAGRESARRLETSEKALEKEKPRKAPRVAEEGETTKMPKHVHKAEVAHNSGSMEPRQSPLDKASAPRQPPSYVSSAAGSFNNKASVPRQAASAAMSSGMPTSIPQSKAAGPRQAAGSSAVAVSSGQLSAGSNLHKVAGPRQTVNPELSGVSAAGSLPQSKAGAQRHTSSSISSAVPKSGTNLPKSKAGTVRQPMSSTTPSDVAATGSMPHTKAGAPRPMSSDTSGPSSGINPSKSKAAARQPTSSTSGVAAGSNAAAQSLAAAVASGNPPVQADVQVTKAAERFAAKEAEDLRREREEAEVKRKEAEAGDQRESDGVVTALQALRRLHLKRDPSELATCLQTLRAYISNLAKYPQEVKYQSINCENSHFRNKVASVEGALAVLQACGFVADGSKLSVDPEFLKTKGAKLWEALSKVDLILEQVKSCS